MKKGRGFVRRSNSAKYSRRQLLQVTAVDREK